MLARFLLIAAFAGIAFVSVSQTESSNSADERSIKEIASNFAAAWNRHDMRAFSDLCTVDADFVVITGKHLKGREEIFAYHDELHKGLFRNRALSAELKDLRFIRPDVAIGHLGFQGRDTAGDTRRNTSALATIVVVKQNDQWLISAFHNTLLTGPAGGALPLDDKRPQTES
jgi:uncharacterized protein (TIGR02246 family)